MTSRLDFRAAKVEIIADAEDTISFDVHVSDMTIIPNPVWTGAVYDCDGVKKADFVCTPTADGCTAVLSETDTEMLGDLAVDDAVVVGQVCTTKSWSGKYRISCAHDNGNRTFVKGPLVIEVDIS